MFFKNILRRGLYEEDDLHNFRQMFPDFPKQFQMALISYETLIHTPPHHTRDRREGHITNRFKKFHLGFFGDGFIHAGYGKGHYPSPPHNGK
jgi:hypothetical protein